ncbi:MAG: 5-oxoprolinase subunit PxpB [Candidatus Bathyarchaeota archaeon]|nr:5-oxoprolinase subunit PxpB [Candidatus Bathyarchaeota archaeon]
MHPPTRYIPVGDRGLLVEFGNTINLAINRKVHTLNQAISHFHIKGVEECVPTYRSLLIYFNSSKTSYDDLLLSIKELERGLSDFSLPVRKQVIEVPVTYGCSYGPDLDYVAKLHGLSKEEVISLHSEREYNVYMIGFVAGFPYLSEVPDSIATPRLKTPRLKVPAGSVGIAGKQTGIYPCESPGGWQIIGRTHIRLFDPKNNPPSLMRPGDIVRFKRNRE